MHSCELPILYQVCCIVPLIGNLTNECEWHASQFTKRVCTLWVHASTCMYAYLILTRKQDSCMQAMKRHSTDGWQGHGPHMFIQVVELTTKMHVFKWNFRCLPSLNKLTKFTKYTHKHANDMLSNISAGTATTYMCTHMHKRLSAISVRVKGSFYTHTQCQCPMIHSTSPWGTNIKYH